MKRPLGAVLAVLAALWAAPAQARSQTYCVGGYEGTPPQVQAACDQPQVRAAHARWHRHSWVSDGARCLVCYDERDQSCQWDFVKHHPDFHNTTEYECAADHTLELIFEHVIEGQKAAPPPPAPAVWTPGVERLTPGPYTAGDHVTVHGALRDGKGTLLPLARGHFHLVDDTGQGRDLAGEVDADGSLSAGLDLPPRSKLGVTFVPDAPALPPQDRLAAAQSAEVPLAIEICGARARVVSPAEGEVLLPGAVHLVAALVDGSGAALPDAGPVALVFHVELEDAPPAELPADGQLQALWTALASPSPRAVHLRAGGSAGARVVCPAGDRAAVVSDLGLGVDAKLPARCFAGVPCRGSFQLVRPPPGPARARLDALLAAPDTRLELVENGAVVGPVVPDAQDRVAVDRTPTSVGNTVWMLQVVTPAGTVELSPAQVRVRPGLELKLPAVLDFGAVRAGSDASAHCVKLDFSASVAAEEHAWTVGLTGQGGCQARPVLLFQNALGQVDHRALAPALEVAALDPARRWLDVCLEVPRCDGEASPDQVALEVAPRTPEFAGVKARVGLKWRVEGRGFLSCQGYWFWPVFGVLTVLFLIVGFVRPARFPMAAAMRVAGSEKGLQQAAAVLLRDCPGSGAGFYRSARLGLHGDGGATGRLAGAVAVLRADARQGLLLEGQGLERLDRRTRKWEPVAARSFVPDAADVYRTGGVWLKVDPG